MSHADALEMVEIGAQLDGLSLRLARLAARFERERGFELDGCPNAIAWLKVHCRLSRGMAMEVMSVARQLPQLPEVERAAASGEIGFQHAAAIAESANRLGPESLFEHQTELVAKAEQADPTAFREEVKRVEHVVDAERMRKEAEWAYRSRGLEVVTKADGRVRVDGLLDPEGGAIFKKALEAAMGARARAESRSERQRRADGLVDVARRCLDGRQLGETGCQRPHLNVQIDATGLGAIDGLGPVPHETIERLLCDCSLSVNGSAEVRTFSPQQRRSIAGRRRTCQFPGCDRPVEWCDGHHLEWYSRDGRTVPSNGALVCGFHHRLVHEGGWNLVREGPELVAIRPP